MDLKTRPTSRPLHGLVIAALCLATPLAKAGVNGPATGEVLVPQPQPTQDLLPPPPCHESDDVSCHRDCRIGVSILGDPYSWVRGCS